MENKYHFALVGAFVVGFITIFIALVVWLTVGTEKVTFLPYQVVTGESVAGLSINSTVDYRGVDVGKVVKIELDKTDPRYVSITLNIKEGTPVKADTMAVLMTKGITGLVSVSLTNGTPDAPNMLPTKKTPIPKISNGPSLSKRLDEAFNSITTSIIALSDQLNKILDEDNARSIAKTLENVEIMTNNLADSSNDLKTILTSGSEIMTRAKPKVEIVLDAMDSLSGVTANVKDASKQLDIFLKSFTDVFNNWSETSAEWTKLAQSTKGLLPNISAITNELKGTFSNLSNLIQEIKNQPNALIMGKKPGPKGPGE